MKPYILLVSLVFSRNSLHLKRFVCKESHVIIDLKLIKVNYIDRRSQHGKVDVVSVSFSSEQFLDIPWYEVCTIKDTLGYLSLAQRIRDFKSLCNWLITYLLNNLFIHVLPYYMFLHHWQHLFLLGVMEYCVTSVVTQK